MSNPWSNSPGSSVENNKSPFYGGNKTKPQNMVAPVEPIQNIPGGIMLCEDNTILVDTSKLFLIRSGRRQAFNSMVTCTDDYNNTMIYGEKLGVFRDIFVNELLKDEDVDNATIVNGYNILELEHNNNFRSQIKNLERNTDSHKCLKWFSDESFVVSFDIMNDIVHKNDISLVIVNIRRNHFENEFNEDGLRQYFALMQESSVCCDIPTIGMIESSEIPTKLSEYADAVAHVEFNPDTDDRMLVSCEKPSTPLFDPFYLYLDGTFVYEKDSLNSDIMNSIGKEIIHPEE